MRFAGNNKIIAAVSVVALICLGAVWLAVEARPAASGTAVTKVFEIAAGDSFRDIANRLSADGVVRSATAFKLLAVLSGEAGKLKPGVYELTPAVSSREILAQLVSGSRREVAVTIPEDSSIYEIDKILSDAGVIKVGSLIKATSSREAEGKLFPDTYKFFTNSSVDEVLNKFSEDFYSKAAPLLQKYGSGDAERILISASLLEKEVPEPEDERIVAGILEKRLKAGIPLQLDATICYVKQSRAYPNGSNCYPLTPLDFRLDSPYNTYLHTGLPPGPIGNPGIEAINAALNPKSSPYWYYLSDPATKKTVFSKTLDEQEQNKIKYLKS